MNRHNISLTLYFMGVFILFMFLPVVMCQPMPVMAPVMTMGYWLEAVSLCFFLCYALRCSPFSSKAGAQSISFFYLCNALLVLGLSSFPRWHGKMLLDGLQPDQERVIYVLAFADLWILCFPWNLVGMGKPFLRLWRRWSIPRTLIQIPGKVMAGLSILFLFLYGFFLCRAIFYLPEHSFGEHLNEVIFFFWYFFTNDASRDVWLCSCLFLIGLHALGMTVTCCFLYRRFSRLRGVLLRRMAFAAPRPPGEATPSPAPLAAPEQDGETI